MSLLNNPNTATQFESDDSDMVTASATAADKATGTAEVKAEQSLVAAKSSSLATSMRSSQDAIGAYKDALRVDYNTLDQLIASNGNFIDRESKTVLGDRVDFDLLSFQDSYVITPGDDKAPKEHLRYSEDGKTCSDGTTVVDHLAALRSLGYDKAAVKQRVVVVGAIIAAAKTDKFNGKLVQFDMSPASRTQWQRFVANATYALTTGRLSQEAFSKVRAEANVKSSKDNDFTVANFSNIV